ncbi:MAG: biopolymer transporter ExbD [Bacteroidetes bacterium]|jgi:biopolymer transport protein ExbD|nr:biopolymer transporter ExbD [Bacteroidota bacterium]
MAIKKKSKISAEFNMSSLTDIIFLLLIFFMLTSSIIAPNALNLKLPGTSQKKSTSQEEYDEVFIARTGSFELNGNLKSLPEIEAYLLEKAGEKPADFNFVIQPEKETPVEYVVSIMDMALRLKINGVLATAPVE